MYIRSVGEVKRIFSEGKKSQRAKPPERFTLATTLLDHKQYGARWLATIYRGRWRVGQVKCVSCVPSDLRSAVNNAVKQEEFPDSGSADIRN